MSQKMLAMFPGQGSQFVGMGKTLCEKYQIARDTFAEASEACGVDMQKLCFEGPEDQLKLTANTQPAILTHSVAVWRVVQSVKPVTPAMFAGHSLGEYSALVAAGKLDFRRAVFLVRKRGQAMQKAVPEGVGAMAAVMNCEAAVLEKHCKDASTSDAQVTPVNYNSPQQIVVAGHKAAVDKLTEILTAAGVRSVPLAVSAPFHSSLMKPAREDMTALLKESTFVANNTSLIPNLNATPSASYGAENLIAQIDNPVLWTQTIEAAVKSGCDSFVEFGPGRVLCGLVKRIAGRAAKIIAVEDPEQLVL